MKVFLVDDHSVFRAGVRAEIGGAVEIVGEAGTVSEAVADIDATRPDVVLLDVHMPDGGGVAVLRGVTSPARFLALSVSDAAEDVISVIRAGARGYVTKTISGAELIDAITRVHTGDAVFSPRLAGFVLDAFARPDPMGAGVVDSPETDREVEEGKQVSDPIVDALTRRELEVLRLLARGYTYKEIGAQLFISVKTVETHASNILRKTQQSNRHALTRWAHSRDLD
ncbi:LuxR C-terminal-related transcriptional regulator [Corynebacterium pseudotuberculosis]|uniref:Response regulator n=1 Tax=Corynebacterium pseudotuberculosis (strain C231) TaxID=681645 RepID=D9QEK0_CORP2|nr:response regulator transcription factor [Corynebacterium pseudotuberculosis]ADK28227.1 response regulator [Corynebacterium pseudotuberculosis FRC41]ADL09923.1 response regulator [Corynebacterium pseudotuberculosis C231]ADL20329.1 response regulator transcription factor [Corynebacterium pseudotuberculosis 1002]ADO25715.1 response regulator [Corynebacterium pseudotuberculosis I19]AEK91767.1 Two-component system transcriptional regulatory protein [Corynebacterium pseudotuberculosis PAT10]